MHGSPKYPFCKWEGCGERDPENFDHGDNGVIINAQRCSAHRTVAGRGKGNRTKRRRSENRDSQNMASPTAVQLARMRW